MLGSPRVPDLHRILIPPTFAIDLLISMIDLPFILGPTMWRSMVFWLFTTCQPLRTVNQRRMRNEMSEMFDA